MDSPTDVHKDGHFDSRSDGSHQDGSQFSEQNPLTKGDPLSFGHPGVPRKPQAVALHGWQRTVGVDEDFDPTIAVCLGAPGTGLSKGIPAHGSSALGPSLGRGKTPEAAPSSGSFRAAGVAPESWDAVRVTREDKREARSLRALPAAPGAAPLPFPRVMSETDASSSSGSPDATSQRQRDSLCETHSSAASSDLGFLVTTGTGSFFGTRPTFGRAVEPRIPATVGEERLHNSLAQYFGQARRETRSEESAIVSLASSTSHDKERSERGTGLSTPVTKTDTRESSLDDFPSMSNINRPGATWNSSESARVSTAESGEERKRGSHKGRGGGFARRLAAVSGATAATDTAKRVASATSTEQSLDDAFVEEGDPMAKPGACESERVEPGQRAPKCNCLRGWPWKVGWVGWWRVQEAAIQCGGPKGIRACTMMSMGALMHYDVIEAIQQQWRQQRR